MSKLPDIRLLVDAGCLVLTKWQQSLWSEAPGTAMQPLQNFYLFPKAR